jgi:hypothetical protein
MYLLIVTACFSFGYEAECQREIELFSTRAECLQIGKAKLDYIEAADPPDGMKLIFHNGYCKRGKDA